MLNSPGIGSGLDVRSIVDRLMAVERQPLVRLDTRAVELRTQVSAYGQLKGALSTFKDAMAKLNDLTKFKVFAAKSSDEAVLSASASSTAAKGTYAITVNRIAENHRLASNQTFADTDTTTIGTVGDTATITVGSNAFTIEVGGKTLGQVRDAINNASTNTGVTASIIKDNAGYRLLVSANDTGSAHAVTVSYSGTDPFTLQTLNTDRDSSGSFTTADLDASLTLENQFNITSSSNSVTDAIEGVTLTLKKSGTITLNVDRDTTAVQVAVNGFTKTYSDLIKTINQLRSQALRSDNNALLDIESQFRNVLNTTVDVEGSFDLAFAIGISTQKDGTLTVNGTTLSNALNSDFNGVANLFADAEQGIAVRLTQLAASFLSVGGAIEGRSSSLDRQVRALDDQRSALGRRLEQVEQRYFRQFSSLDTLVARLQSTGTLLTQQLSALSSNTGGSR